ncbi:hypothetical protein M0R89_16955 [Halorussus limi]|uniref:DUF7344 domain-containing protein n=1 Tax=Halorussus limi TaxID=2938695 RepID=A0A8U0HT31_9EURY|nr:hypothetical protein [Halorussus limi]UPV74215.1 hypothetical protein M0R89_16955 [Halorussus limi]
MSLTDEGDSRSLTPDTAFDLLGDGERRRALAALREFDDAVSLDRLAEATAARLEGTTPDDVATDQCERTAAMLHHAHLPRLEDADVVSYDPMSGEVELTEVGEELDPYFEVMEEYRESVPSE